mmetsp:Transcript_101564/g.310584  ORF Transcript_101564/g.310584 Transcript_101564/m.310584 type:complete len:318 (+) Transcript_101564:876-1829(+)
MADNLVNLAAAVEFLELAVGPGLVGLLRVRPGLLPGRAQGAHHDRGDEPVHHGPSELDLRREDLAEEILQGVDQRLAQDREVLLVDPVTSMPNTELREHGHELAHVVQPGHGGADRCDHLGEDPVDRRRIVRVGVLAVDHVDRPVAVLVAHLGREVLRGAGRGLEEAEAKPPAHHLRADDLHSRPALLHGAAHLAGRQHVLRPGRGPALDRRPRVVLRPVAAELAQALPELDHVAARDADVHHVGVLDVEQSLHVVEAVVDERLRVLRQASVGEEGHDGVVLHDRPVGVHRLGGRLGEHRHRGGRRLDGHGPKVVAI